MSDSLTMLTKKVQTSNEEKHDRVLAASIDGRCHNVRYRQNQMHLLHAYLRTHLDSITAAIQLDSGCSEEEALSETATAIFHLSELYRELDFDRSIGLEYGVRSGKDDLHRRVPYGIVIVRPAVSARFFSVISPLAAAVAAGNCVVIELPNTLRQIDILIKEAISGMDSDAFMVSANHVVAASILSKSLLIDPTPNLSRTPDAVHCQVDQHSVAVVHRDANVPSAARSICTAKFRFQGSSSFAPVLVLVNEWVKKSFIRSCLECITEEEATLATAKPRARLEEEVNSSVLPLSIDEFDCHYSSSRIKFLELKKGTSVEKLNKVEGRTLVMVSVTGLVDAVTIASSIPDILACHIFATLADANFLSNQISSELTFVNHIPPHMLVGPAVMQSLSRVGPHLRYDTYMMSKPHPNVVNKAPGLYADIAEVLSFDSLSDSDKRQKLGRIREHAIIPLKPTGQASGTSMGFFDQGIITGVVAFVLPTLCVAGFGTFWLGRMAFRTYFGSSHSLL